MTLPDLSLVIPVYNEVENLPVLAEEIHVALAGSAHTFEVIWVDDGSTDGSGASLERLCAGDRRHRLVRLMKNQGQSAALAAGFRRTRGAVTVTLDSDLQNDPRDIPSLLAALEGHDLVSGVRVTRRDSWVRRWSSRVANRVRSWVLEDGVTDVGCSLKAYRTEYLRHLPEFKGMHRFLPALVLMQGGRLRELPVNHRPRRFGVAKYGIGNRLWRGLADLGGVAWLKKRWIDPRLERELTPPPEVERP
ncbi:MAG TPA: glycosyltransferase family 2 protein [Thermoanaerobaculia bacterium]|nr:glycosyltransferase family 2 protein [Thermoanaerobaculia bacterium]